MDPVPNRHPELLAHTPSLAWRADPTSPATYSYADIAFYLAQFFAARHTVPIGTEHIRLLAWRKRVAERPGYDK